jgi:amino acid adenylation domain-containing protein
MDVLVQRAGSRSPDTPAVASPEGRLTHKALEERASAWAARVRESVSESEPIVAIAASRSVEFVGAVLGCWKAGAAYLPIDPTLPDDRIKFQLHDSRARLVIAHGAEAARLRQWASVLDFDDSDRMEQRNTRSLARPEHAAYIIYTSGSTGPPKAVVVEHRNLVSYTRAVIERLELRPGSSWAAVSSFATDLAHTALFPSLASGGCVHVVPQDLALDSRGLADYIVREQIDSLKITPSHLSALLGDSVQPLPTKRLVLGGEALHWSLVHRVKRFASNCAVYNHYGPTEATVGACVYHCRDEQKSHDGSVPIGRALPNTHTYVLDPALHLVSPNDLGELFLGGEGIARGYLNQPSVTAERFLTDPFSDSQGARMYRTGDLVRTTDEGDLVFMGREDHQVKLRGHRVELGEIEVTLLHHHAIRQAVVVTEERDSSAMNLVAYFVADSALTGEELGGFLAQTLPSYLIPARFTRIERLPLLPSGKVDRDALSELSQSAARVPAAAPHRPSPTSELSEAVLEIYRTVLDDPSLSESSDFLSSGGNSLLSVKLAVLIEEATGVVVSVADIFIYPSAASLAELLEKRASPTATEVRGGT